MTTITDVLPTIAESASTICQGPTHEVGRQQGWQHEDPVVTVDYNSTGTPVRVVHESIFQPCCARTARTMLGDGYEAAYITDATWDTNGRHSYLLVVPVGDPHSRSAAR